MTLRQKTSLVKSSPLLVGLDRAVPGNSTLCRRQTMLNARLPYRVPYRSAPVGLLNLLIDSTGIKTEGPRGKGVECLSRNPGRVDRSFPGRPQRPISRNVPARRMHGAAHCGRDWVSADLERHGTSALPARDRAIRKRCPDSQLQPWFCWLGAECYAKGAGAQFSPPAFTRQQVLHPSGRRDIQKTPPGHNGKAGLCAVPVNGDGRKQVGTCHTLLTTFGGVIADFFLSAKTPWYAPALPGAHRPAPGIGACL